jgi:hypothetical protein
MVRYQAGKNTTKWWKTRRRKNYIFYSNRDRLRRLAASCDLYSVLQSEVWKEGMLQWMLVMLP